MFIPLEGENILFLANVVAIYRSGDKTVILKRGGTEEITSFTPATLFKRYKAFAAEEAAAAPHGAAAARPIGTDENKYSEDKGVS